MKRKQNLILQPVLKWAGGKRQLLPQLENFFPKKKQHKLPLVFHRIFII